MMITILEILSLRMGSFQALLISTGTTGEIQFMNL